MAFSGFILQLYMYWKPNIESFYFVNVDIGNAQKKNILQKFEQNIDTFHFIVYGMRPTKLTEKNKLTKRNFEENNGNHRDFLKAERKEIN